MIFWISGVVYLIKFYRLLRGELWQINQLVSSRVAKNTKAACFKGGGLN